VLAAKEVLRPDFGWLSGYEGIVAQHIEGLSNLVSSFIPGLDKTANLRYFSQSAMSTYTADLLQLTFVKQFVGKSENEIDLILQSFRLQDCIQNKKLNSFIEKCFSGTA
jgi:hypothetical protein